LDDEFGKDAQACRHALELTNLLQDSLELILDERKSRAENLSRMLPNILYQFDPPSDGEDFDSDSEFDSDSDDDDVMMMIGLHQVHVKESITMTRTLTQKIAMRSLQSSQECPTKMPE